MDYFDNYIIIVLYCLMEPIKTKIYQTTLNILYLEYDYNFYNNILNETNIFHLSKKIVDIVYINAEFDQHTNTNINFKKKSKMLKH